MKYNDLAELLQAFPDEATCVTYLEKLRWPTGIVCPHCASTRKIYKVSRKHGYKCADCRKAFSVRKGTVFEGSRLPLKKWFAASWLVTINSKGISRLQLSRKLRVTQRTAEFMLKRLREVTDSINDDNALMDDMAETDKTGLNGNKCLNAKYRTESQKPASDIQLRND